MRLYGPNHSIVGGHLGRVFGKVVNTAQKFAKSNLGRKIGAATKKQLLQAGSNVLNKVISGEQSVLPAIKTNVTSLRSQLTNSARKRVKNLILRSNKKPKRNKLGGLTLYKLSKRNKSSSRATTRYKLNKGKQIKLYKLNKRRGGGKKKPPEGIDKRRYKLNPKRFLGWNDTQRYKLSKKSKKGGGGKRRRGKKGAGCRKGRRKKGVGKSKKTSRLGRGRRRTAAVKRRGVAKRRVKKKKKRKKIPKSRRAVKRSWRQKSIFGS